VEKVRAHVLIVGRVQGVCFRAHTQDEARRRNVAGWVKNRIDGSVEAILEGEKADVQALITWCHTGPPHAKVKKVEVGWESHTGDFADFSVAY
jgi:acylphosphatase